MFNDGNKFKLIGTFEDKSNFGARFWVHISDESTEALTWAAVYLNEKYKDL